MSETRKNSKAGDAPSANDPVADDAALLTIEQQREALIEIRLRRSHIPRKFLAKTLKDFETRGSTERKQIVQMAREYVGSFSSDAEAPRRGAILHGPTGSGKTHILAGILRELTAKGRKTLFYGAPNLFKDLRSTYSGDSEFSEEELLEDVVNAEILALDDLGAEKTSDWVLDRLYWIINERYQDSRPILITTNLHWPDELEKIVQRRIVSRLAEMCRVIGPFPDEDWRMKAGGLKPRLR